MSQQNNFPNSSTSTPPDLTAKRKRGRPRKEITQTPLLGPTPKPTVSVSGFVEGMVNGGYQIAVRAGPNNTLLRGVVFRQGHFSPITPVNDIAPQVEMHRNSGFPVLGSNPKTQVCTSHSVQCAKQQVQADASTVAQHQVVAMEMLNYQPAPVTVPDHPVNMPKDESGVPLGGNSMNRG